MHTNSTTMTTSQADARKLMRKGDPDESLRLKTAVNRETTSKDKNLHPAKRENNDYQSARSDTHLKRKHI